MLTVDGCLGSSCYGRGSERRAQWFEQLALAAGLGGDIGILGSLAANQAQRLSRAAVSQALAAPSSCAICSAVSAISHAGRFWAICSTRVAATRGITAGSLWRIQA